MTEAPTAPPPEVGPEKATERTSVTLTPSERAAVDFVQEVHRFDSIPEVLRQFSINDCVQIHQRALAAAARPAA